MNFAIAGLHFTNVEGAVLGHHPVYALLSYAIAAAGAYTALELAERRRHCPPATARLWHMGASATLGGSIWAMHFIGMMAARIEVPHGFEPGLTVLSLLIAIAASGLAFRLLRAGGDWQIAPASLVLGLGIATMHYVGMAAMRLPGMVAYRPGLWGISLLIAIATAILALWLSQRQAGSGLRCIAALTMAAGICGMHYTGMAAAVVLVDPTIAPMAGGDPDILAVAVIGITLALLLLALVSAAADQRLVAAHVREAAALRRSNADLLATQHEIVARLCYASELKDRDTGGHVMRMAQVTYLLAVAAGWDQELATSLRNAAPLHDIGKLGIPDRILNKQCALDSEEWEAMRAHTEIGARILGGSALPLLKLGAEIALTHHEKWDGTGYPRGLAGTDIPLAGRIVAVADVFDALMSERPYKQAWELARVLDHMMAQAGRHFDPTLIATLIRDAAAIAQGWSECTARAHTQPARAANSATLLRRVS